MAADRENDRDIDRDIERDIERDRDVDGVLAALSRPLSLRRRVLAVVALLGGLVVAAVTGLLWITEPGLPPRTAVAFGGIVVAALAWAVYGVWVLTRRTPLLARDRVIAAWMGLATAAVFAVIAFVVTALRHRVEPVLFVAVLVMVAFAGLNLVSARSRRAALLRRKRELDDRRSSG